MNLSAVLPLNDRWQLLPIDRFRQGFYPQDDEFWIEQDLPAHWQQHPLLKCYIGKMVYRKRFRLGDFAPSGVGGQFAARYWLRFNGIFYWSQVYFNGVDFGRHEGYFIAQEHDVTAWVGDENVVVVEVECPTEDHKYHKRLITGVFSHWDCIDPHTNPGGIWLPIELIRSGPTRLAEVLLDVQSCDAARAVLHFRTMLDSVRDDRVVMRWTFAPQNFAGEVQVIEQEHDVRVGVQSLGGMVTIRDPQRWWTHDLGHPSLYWVTVEVLYDEGVSDVRSFTYGIRHFELRGWIPFLNGVRFLAKGNNYAPGDTRIATMTVDRCVQDMGLACAAHMNMLRVHAHVDHPALYAAADAAGVLLWQDFPLQWLYDRAVFPEAQRQLRLMVRQLFNHPSIVVWCMHNEAVRVVEGDVTRFRTVVRTYASVFLHNWNRDVMDSRLKQIAEEEDRTRPAVRSSGEFAVPFLRAGTDSHFYHGWYRRVFGSPHAWEPVARFFPKTIRFVTEFGSQSFPNVESCQRFMPLDFEQIDWAVMAERHHFQVDVLSDNVDWRGARSLEELVVLTQEYQSTINRFFIDRLRFYKYRPTGGILAFLLQDPDPAISFSVVDYWRVPKRSYDALRMAFSPQYFFTLLRREEYSVGAAIDVPLYVVNDEHRGVSVCAHARLFDPSGGELACVMRTISLPADCLTQEVDRLRLTPSVCGRYRLVLALWCEGHEVLCQEYAIVVV